MSTTARSYRLRLRLFETKRRMVMKGLYRWALSSIVCLAGFAAATGCGDSDGAGGGSDGGGGSGTGGEGASVGGGGADPGPSAQLFSVNDNDGVVSFARPEALEGRVDPATDLPAGADTDMYGPRDLAISAAHELFVANENDGAITIYADAMSATGATLPTRKWKGAATGLDAPISLALDEETDVAYVVNSLANGTSEKAILAFADASTADGDVAPARRIEVDTAEIGPLQILERDDRLFVVSQLSGNATTVLVFDDASSLDGLVAPSREIRDASWGNVLSIYIDDADRLFAVDAGTRIFRYDGVSALDGTIEAVATIDVDGASGLSAVAFDDAGTMFVADRSLAYVFAFDEGAALASGVAAPSRSFDSVELRSPSRLAFVRP
ncbi:MAG: hypothetical protein HOW73_28040 [Polyangiaceae bacterium]|nr:hypothetical protein [Polyangiaceae bacterium]